MFELHVPANYTAKFIAEIEDFDPDQYGNKWYNVLFEGDAETFMWLAKNPPEAGKTYYGHIEPTKSGKRLRFKTDKLPEGVKPPSSSKASTGTLDYEPSTNTRWAIALAYRAFVQATGSVEDSGGEFPFKAVKLHASELLRMFDDLKNGGSGLGQPTLPNNPTQVETASSQSTATSLGEQFRNRDKAVSYDDPPEHE